MAEDFNLEVEYGWFIDGIVSYVDENPDVLEHFGVKGMKWGVRKARTPAPELTNIGPSKIVRTTKSGEQITLLKKPPGRIAKFLAKRSEKYREDYGNSAYLTIHDSTGKKVGDAMVDKRSKDELYLNWLGIDKGSRGKGYATAAMHTAEEFGRQSGFKKMTLEVPGNSPDARHIYEKLGFQVTKEDIDPTDPVWGGLTEMEYVFKGKSAAHMDVDDFLAHYGVKGMKWGRRKKETAPASDEASTAKAIRTKAKQSKTASLTNAELRAAIDRMQLEQNFKRLSVNEKSPVSRFISSTLLEIGKREVQAAVGKKVAKTVARKALTGGVG